MSTLRPFHDRVFIRPTEVEEKTKGGLFLPAQARERPMTGIVVSKGPGKLNEHGQLQPVAAQIGEMVLFGKHAGTRVVVNDEELLMVMDGDIFAGFDATPSEPSGE